MMECMYKLVAVNIQQRCRIVRTPNVLGQAMQPESVGVVLFTWLQHTVDMCLCLSDLLTCLCVRAAAAAAADCVAGVVLMLT